MFTKNFNKVMHQQQNLIKAYHQNELIWEGITWIDIPYKSMLGTGDGTFIYFNLSNLPEIAYEIEFKFNNAYSNFIESITYMFATFADDSFGNGEAEDRTRYHLGYSSTKFPKGAKSLSDFHVITNTTDSKLLEEIKNNLNLQYRIVK